MSKRPITIWIAMLIPIPYILLHSYVLVSQAYLAWTFYSAYGIPPWLTTRTNIRLLPLLVAVTISITSIVAIWMRKNWGRWIYLLSTMAMPAMFALDLIYDPITRSRDLSTSLEMAMIIGVVNSPFLVGFALLSVGKKARAYFAGKIVEGNAEKQEPPPPPSFENH